MESFNSEMILFQPPVVNHGIEYLQWIKCRPVNQIMEDISIDIHLKAIGSQYLDLQRSRLYVKAKIVNENGDALKTTDIVTPVNLWLQSLWNQVDVFFQQKLVSSSGTNYAYKALMDVLLNYGYDATNNQLQTQLYYKDTVGSMDHTKPNETPFNIGLMRRNNLSKSSAFIDMVGPIYGDVFQMPRYLLNEVDVHVKLFQSKNSFRLLSSVPSKKYKVVISEVMLEATMIGIHADILIFHAHALEDTQALYPLLKTEVKTFAVGKGQYNVNLDDIFQGKIPNRLILGMVSADAYAGDLTKNPFNFKHYNFICLYANGQSVPSKALQPKFASDNYVEAFQTLFTGMELDGKHFRLYLLGWNRTVKMQVYNALGKIMVRVTPWWSLI